MSGVELVPGDDWSNIIYMSLCMDQGTGHSLQVSLGLSNVPLGMCLKRYSQLSAFQ